jgi:hypothetical protein
MKCKIYLRNNNFYLILLILLVCLINFVFSIPAKHDLDKNKRISSFLQQEVDELSMFSDIEGSDDFGESFLQDTRNTNDKKIQETKSNLNSIKPHGGIKNSQTNKITFTSKRSDKKTKDNSKIEEPRFTQKNIENSKNNEKRVSSYKVEKTNTSSINKTSNETKNRIIGQIKNSSESSETDGDNTQSSNKSNNDLLDNSKVSNKSLEDMNSNKNKDIENISKENISANSLKSENSVKSENSASSKSSENSLKSESSVSSEISENPLKSASSENTLKSENSENKTKPNNESLNKTAPQTTLSTLDSTTVNSSGSKKTSSSITDENSKLFSELDPNFVKNLLKIQNDPTIKNLINNKPSTYSENQSFLENNNLSINSSANNYPTNFRFKEKVPKTMIKNYYKPEELDMSKVNYINESISKVSRI